jgi:excinuclease ABC subunit A|tara:strand:- start:67762 stop:73344 length:5583 start_codon:yes stop_codon:yes gene_type:complete
MSTTAPTHIRLRGVRQNNLKNFDLDLPLGKLVVVTGLSGAGKSSLVFETLHAEGQRRYVETFSPYARQFMDMLDRPQVDSIENIRPSIAIEQSNTVRTSRSTVGTMTELTDYYKVWFSHVAELFDPETGEKIEDDNPASIWTKARIAFPSKGVLLAFRLKRPEKMSWAELLEPLSNQGYSRIVAAEKLARLDGLDPASLAAEGSIFVIQDRLKLTPKNRTRFIEAATASLHFGQGQIYLLSANGAETLDHYAEGLHLPGSDVRYEPATPNLFSFNSPVGACSACRGFGRVIEIDDNLVIPDRSLSLVDGAIRAFQGAVYSESLRDLLRACKKHNIPTDIPFGKMRKAHQRFVYDGEPGYDTDKSKKWPKGWYGVRRFFKWLENNTYKMHVRVFLSKYRAYVSCPECKGTRLKPDALNWRWKGHRLPDLYELPVRDLLALFEAEKSVEDTTDRGLAVATGAIRSRLHYLDQVGLGYLTLNRSSRTLSGGETQRVNLTACLGTALVDTLFVLDEPSVGLHARDINRLIGILRQLTAAGNTVVVVEHDESVMHAADEILEIGPRPGNEGGEIIFQGPVSKMLKNKASLTGAYLSGREQIELPSQRRPVKLKGRNATPALNFKDVHKHNLTGIDLHFPLGRFVALSGVSGSGKSTVLNNVIHQGLLARAGKAVEEPARIGKITTPNEIGEIVLVDRTPVSKTPRSTPILFVDAWDHIRTLFASTEDALAAGLITSHFSFNSGHGRCDHCQGLGHERIEMQFMADVYVTCPVCEGKRFRDEVLEITWNGKNAADVLAFSVDEAILFFAKQTKIIACIRPLTDVGLSYLPLGQPLNTLSGGESQRLKLVKFLGRFAGESEPALLLLDEPTTGLHRADIKRLLVVLQRLVDAGHSLAVIEHQMDVLKSADWIIELGPEAGDRGGEVVYAGTPEGILDVDTETARFLSEELGGGSLAVAEPQSPFITQHASFGRKAALSVIGARQHNLRDISVDIPHGEWTVVTGVSGSGKSSLAFDIIFAEGQRRFMESMSPWARQYVEQLPRPDIDSLTGIAPTVAIEQRVTRGSRKSTVATITEVAQYLRLLYTRIGIQHSPKTGEPLIALSRSALLKKLESTIGERSPKKGEMLYLYAPLIRGRKGHHQPIADWAKNIGYDLLRCDGRPVRVTKFKKLDRYSEHDVEVAVGALQIEKEGSAYSATLRGEGISLSKLLDETLRLGKGAAFLADAQGRNIAWYSTKRTDPTTGESFPELDPKHFSWNSTRGWCTSCRGHGQLHQWMLDDEKFENLPLDFVDGKTCTVCKGSRLNPQSSAVYLHCHDGTQLSLPQLLGLAPSALLKTLSKLKLDRRGKAIVKDLRPEIEERLKFMDEVGLSYLTLDRSTITLSGGEAQRIRLAAQLGSNLSGVLYVLDEPSIGLHARDNDRLLDSLARLQKKGNTLLVVEHNLETMRHADRIIDLGPDAGINGGHILANGKLEALIQNKDSLTGHYLKNGIQHPLRGQYRTLPPKYSARRKTTADEWIVLKEPRLRNLKGGQLTLPKERLIGICGVSGAGKSTLIRDLLIPVVERAIRLKKDIVKGSAWPGLDFGELRHANVFRTVVEVDQSPIGKTLRSTPATYIGAFDLIRKFFGQIPEAKMRGFGPGTFSFNTKDGRCPECKGAGKIKLEMSFMPDTYVECDACRGKRYGAELLDLTWNEKNIADILAMSFEEAVGFFHFHTRLEAMMQLMVETGLGYLELGQSSPTLSGGEAQRLKLVSELIKGLPTFTERKHGIVSKNLYVLEEPTIGLHLRDCERLIELLHRLVDQGHTVILIEHHLDLIAEADYLVEIGPNGGDGGGKILYQGSVDGLLKAKSSPTAPFLRPLLSRTGKS